MVTQSWLDKVYGSILMLKAVHVTLTSVGCTHQLTVKHSAEFFFALYCGSAKEHWLITEKFCFSFQVQSLPSKANQLTQTCLWKITSYPPINTHSALYPSALCWLGHSLHWRWWWSQDPGPLDHPPSLCLHCHTQSVRTGTGAKSFIYTTPLLSTAYSSAAILSRI